MKLKPKALRVLFFIWSFGPFLAAVRHIRDKRYHGVILLFSFVYGYSVFLYSGDVVRYAESFELMTRAGWDDFLIMLKGPFGGDEVRRAMFGLAASQPDFYASTLQFFVSRFTENFRWFFALVSLFYTWLFLKFVRVSLLEVTWINSCTQKVFFCYLLLVVPFYVGVTGVRFWTALFLFMIFALEYVRERQKIYLLGATLSILVHFSFFVPVAFLVIYHTVNFNRNIIVAVALISVAFFFVTSNSQILNYVQSSSSLFGETEISYRLEGYSDQENLSERKERVAQTNWYVQLRSKLLVYVLLILTFLELFGVFRYQENNFIKKLYPFFLLFFVLTMFTYNLGSIGRFKNIFYLTGFLRYAVLAGLNPGNRTLRAISVVMFGVLILHVLVTFRSGFYTIDPILLVGNPFLLYMYQSDISLSELIVGH